MSPDGIVSELGELLSKLNQDAPSTGAAPASSRRLDNQLVQVRLGIASALYTALRCKHAPTASHSLRVALRTSAWAAEMGMGERDRDLIEVAALLHDVGVIGVPDQVLLKPDRLDSDELLIIECSRKMGLEILRRACAEKRMLQVVGNIGAWYDGSKRGYRLAGEQIPLGSRMIAIVEAFDAMTSDQVFRRALSHERAIRELFGYAGVQFDPNLVRQFSELNACETAEQRDRVVSHWLRNLDPRATASYWELTQAAPDLETSHAAAMFQARLLNNMHDAVVFVDANLHITQWNHGAERLTGIASPSISGRRWLPSLLSMRNEKGDVLAEEDCPIACTIHTGVQSLRRLSIAGRSGEVVSVDSHAIPVAGADGAVLGAILLLHDASPETSLEQRCQSLHEKATRDPLTQVANRAEFDRVHEMFVNAHRQQKVPCALMICDLDHFKKVNDTYGHQAGDEAIQSLASLLKSACRPGDLVARYGGEEFVMLFADCDNATAARRAEQIRSALEQVLHPKLQGRPVTASFGVTEIQPGDTPETMLRRADRALLAAKQHGRNRVMQLGAGSSEEDDGWRGFWMRKPSAPKFAVTQELRTPVPLKVADEKLRGFVADHQAKILKADANHLRLELSDEHPGRLRRRSDRPVVFVLDVRLEEEQWENAARQSRGGGISQTKVHVAITLRNDRDRRRENLDQRAREFLASFRSYLMATPDESANGNRQGKIGGGTIRRVGRALVPWLMRESGARD